MHVLCDFSMCLLEFSYTFEHIWTNLLTQCTQLSVTVFCYFCISGFPAIKSAQKFRKNYIKNHHPGRLRNHQRREGGHHRDSRRVPGMPPPRRRRAPSWLPCGHSQRPLRLYLALGVETPNIDLFSANSPLYRRRRCFKIGAAWRSCSGTLPEGETPGDHP